MRSTYLKGKFPMSTHTLAHSSRRQRRAQFRQQMIVLAITLGITTIAAGTLIALNWWGAGSTQTISCEDYPLYCVPFAGGLPEDQFEPNEAAEVRSLDAESTAAEGVIRGYQDGFPLLGNPDAPIQFVLASNFTCGHCQSFHKYILPQFIEDYVLTGKASFQIAMLSVVGGDYTRTANQAAFCAGEQGAIWEMIDELFRLGNAYSPSKAFDPQQIRSSASNMGLDAESLESCIRSGRYEELLDLHNTFRNDQGIGSTPTILYKIGNTGPWGKLVGGDECTYENLAALTEQANQP